MEMNIKKIIDGLYFTVGMMLFNPATGASKTPDELNEDDRYTYDACMGAIELLKGQEPPTDVSISSAIECLLHPQDADGSDMVKAIDVAVKALKLLKAQEPGNVNITITQSDGWKEGNCPFCGMKVDSFYNWSFCGTCGKGLEWE